MSMKTTVDRMGEVRRALKFLSKNAVLVGVPAEETARDPVNGKKPKLNNAEIAFIQNYGSPKANIPARPFMEPGIRKAQKQIQTRFKKAARVAFDGDTKEADRQLSAVGQETRDHIKAVIRAGLQPELAASTLRARKNRKHAPRTGEKPLIDTGQLINSISYVIE